MDNRHTLGPLQSMSSLQSVGYWHLSPTLNYDTGWGAKAYHWKQSRSPWDNNIIIINKNNNNNNNNNSNIPSPWTLAKSSRHQRWSGFPGSRPTVFLSICHFHVRAGSFKILQKKWIHVCQNQNIIKEIFWHLNLYFPPHSAAWRSSFI